MKFGSRKYIVFQRVILLGLEARGPSAAAREGERGSKMKGGGGGGNIIFQAHYADLN